MIYFLKRKLIDFLPPVLLLVLLSDEVRTSHGSIVRTAANFEGANGITALNAKRQPNNGGGGSGEIMKSTSYNLDEPSCEELKAMWQFSRRQSRASEITNEIPTYHDPFSMNVWDPYYPTTTRSLGGRRISSRYRYGSSGRPVYGRVVHQPSAQQIAIGGRYYDVPTPLERGRTGYENFMNIKPFSGPENVLLGNQQQQPVAASKNMRMQQKVRFSGKALGSNLGSGNAPSLPQHAIFGSTGLNQIAPQRGSFQRLKELVWTERARELSQQRKSEEIAARAAILKDITNGQHYKASMSSPPSSRRAKSGGLNSNKNKLLKNESKGLSSKDDDMQQLMARSSAYWPPSENSKRSSPPQNGDGNFVYAPDTESEYFIREYLAAAAAAAAAGGGGGMPAEQESTLGEAEVIEEDDDNDEDGPYYDSNEFFNRLNEDNINDFYFYINRLLGKKPNQKSI